MCPDVTTDPRRWRRTDWEDPDAVYFWLGRGGEYERFSNFAYTTFQMRGWLPELGVMDFPTGEHAFQAAKATTLDDHNWIRRASTPNTAKHIGGGKVAHPVDGHRVALPPGWNERTRFEVMLTVVRHKFQVPHLRELLLSTGDRLICEDSPYDDEWGCRRKVNGVLTYTGDNYLGRALMRVRDEIRAA